MVDLMLPVKLLFYPMSIVRTYPLRKWREVTLWLKWGLLFSIGAPLLRVLYSSSPESFSKIFRFLNYLAAENDSLTLNFPVKFGLFCLLLILVVVLTWLIRAGIIFLLYQFIDVTFDEGPIALSLAGASLVNGIWLLVPFGWYLAPLHGMVLIAYLAGNVNRIDLPQAILVGILAGWIPFFV